MTKKKDNHLQALFKLVRDSRKEQLFNSKKHLLLCANGVNDLKVKRFREAEPTNYSTMSTNIKYVPYDEHPVEKPELLDKYSNDIVLDREELINFLLKVISSTLDAFVKDQQFYMFHGKGANGKSLLVKFIKKALGNYSAPIPSAQVSKPSVNAQSASPSLMALLHKRGAFLTEMEDKLLFTEFLKLIAGGDKTSGRKLHKEQKNISLGLKVLIAVNNLPNIEDKTHGCWRKLVLIPFDAKFVDTEPKDDNEKKIIDGFEEQLLECANTFLALLVKTYITSYATEGVRKSQHPKIVQELGKKYQESQNIPLQFVNACVKESSEKAYIRTKILEDAFSQYCKGKGITRTPHLMRHLYELMDNCYPPKNDGRQIWMDGKNLRGWKGAVLEIEQAEDEGEPEAENEIDYQQVEKEVIRAHWGR